MARPTKQGLDYFPLDVQFDDKIELLIAEVGSDALSVLITVWQLIYQNNGYYIEDNTDLCLLVRRRIMLDIDIIALVISKAIDRNIFDKAVHSAHKILTSKAIQKRYFIASIRKKSVSVCNNYILIDVSAYINLVPVGVNVSINATNVDVDVEVNEDVDEEEKAKKTKQPKKTCVCPDWIPLSHWEELLKNRTFKKLQNTELALKKFVNSLQEAVNAGYRVEDCIEEYVACKWQRFDHSWMDKTEAKKTMQPRNLREAQSIQSGEIAKILLKEREDAKYNNGEESGLFLEHKV